MLSNDTVAEKNEMVKGSNTCKIVAESKSVQWNDAPNKAKITRNIFSISSAATVYK